MLSQVKDDYGTNINYVKKYTSLNFYLGKRLIEKVGKAAITYPLKIRLQLTTALFIGYQQNNLL